MALYETPYGPLGRREARLILSESQNHRCCYCGVGMIDPYKHATDGRRCTIEHIVPISAGGTNAWHNIVAACSDCNSYRGGLHGMNAIAFFYARLRGEVIVPPSPRRRKPANRGIGHASMIARNAAGEVIATFRPKAQAYIEQVYGPHDYLSRGAFFNLPARKGMSRKARKKVMLAMVGYDVPFGHFRLPKESTPAKPIEGATLGSVWPKVGNAIPGKP